MSRLLIATMMALLCFSASPSWAEDDAYRFRSSEPVKSDTDKTLKFSQPAEETEAVDEGPTEVAALNYPKHSVKLMLLGTGTELRNEVTPARFYTASTGANAPGLLLNYQLDAALDSYMGFTGEVMRVQVPDSSDRNGQNIFVGNSSADLQSFQFYSSLMCQIGESSFNKFCFGYQASYSAFLGLDYPQTTTTVIHLATARDLTVGLHAYFTHELSGKSTWFTQFATNFGFGFMQNRGFAVKDSQNYNLQVGTECPFYNIFLNAKLEVDYTKSNMKSADLAATVWKVNQTNYMLGLGLRYEWGSSNR